MHVPQGLGSAASTSPSEPAWGKQGFLWAPYSYKYGPAQLPPQPQVSEPWPLLTLWAVLGAPSASLCLAGSHALSQTRPSSPVLGRCLDDTGLLTVDIFCLEYTTGSAVRSVVHLLGRP